MSFPDFIARRYFFGRQRLFATFLSVVAVLGVALGVLSLVVVMSVMTGFSSDLQQKLLGLSPHIIIENFSGAPKGIDKYLDNYAVVVEGEGIMESLTGGQNTAQGVKAKGMSNEDIKKIKNVELYVAEAGGCILGSELAFQMNVSPGTGEKVKITSPMGRIGPTGEFMPDSLECNVGGVFKTGYFEHDSKLVLMPLNMAERLFGLQGRKSVFIWLNDMADVEKAAGLLKKEFPDNKVVTWTQSNQKLFSALKLERAAMAALLFLMVVTACISIVGVTFMYVFTRRRDVAILSAVGAARKDITNIFIRVGGYIGLIGSAIGITAGLLLCFYLKYHRIELPSSYYLDSLPVVISPVFFITVAISAVLIAMACALYPALQAASLKPQQVLRYE